MKTHNISLTVFAWICIGCFLLHTWAAADWLINYLVVILALYAAYWVGDNQLLRDFLVRFYRHNSFGNYFIPAKTLYGHPRFFSILLAGVGFLFSLESTQLWLIIGWAALLLTAYFWTDAGLRSLQNSQPVRYIRYDDLTDELQMLVLDATGPGVIIRAIYYNDSRKSVNLHQFLATKTDQQLQKRLVFLRGTAKIAVAYESARKICA